MNGNCRQFLNADSTLYELLSQQFLDTYQGQWGKEVSRGEEGVYILRSPRH
jgi:hypothetical protein